MSILDTFFILFESDASKLDKGLDDARKKGKDAAHELTAVDEVAHKLGHSLKESVAELGVALVSAFALEKIGESIREAAEYADELGKASQRLGIGVEDLSAWSDAVKKNGGTTESFTNSMEQFNQSLIQVDATGKGRAIPFLKQLGINMEDAHHKGKMAIDLLPELAERFQKLSSPKAQALGQRLGLDRATVMTLQAGRKAVEEMIAKEKELGAVTKEQVEVSEKFNDQIDDTKHAFRSLWLVTAEAVLPALTWVMEKFQDLAVWMRHNSTFITGLLIAIGVAILAFVVPPLLAAGGAALVAMAPFLLLGAIIAGLAVAFAALYDDVVNFMEGNDSLIGSILQKWPVIGEVVNEVVAIVKGLGDVLGWTFSTMFDLLQIAFNLWQRAVSAVLEFTGVFDGVRALAELVSAGFAELESLVSGVWDRLTDKVRQFMELVASAVALVKGVAGAITAGLGHIKVGLGIAKPDEPVAQGVEAGKAALGAAGASNVGALSSTAITHGAKHGGDKNVHIGKVEVNTQATDADGIARGIGDTLGSHMRQAAGQFDDGVAA